MSSEESLHRLSSHLGAESGKLSRHRVVAGFDGFVDEIISVVQERRGPDKWEPVPDIASFSGLIAKAAGHSSLREIVITRLDAGGCAVNFADGLAELGVKVDCFATMGTPRHPAFDDVAKKLHGCYSWGREYGRTLAFEFADGKLMYSAVSQLAEFDTALLDAVLTGGAYLNSCREAQVIALTDWTLYPHMTGCWQKLQKEVYSQLKHRPYFFIDLVDPSSRADTDILSMLQVLSGFERHGKTVLGLNGNEANILSRVLGLDLVGTNVATVKKQSAALRERLGISQVLIHHRKFAVAADEKNVCHGNGPFCAAPKKSTGAGDRFNAGYCLGLLFEFDPFSCLNLAAGVTGFFVRNGYSATLEKLIPFIENWAKGDPDAPRA